MNDPVENLKIVEFLQLSYVQMDSSVSGFICSHATCSACPFTTSSSVREISFKKIQ